MNDNENNKNMEELADEALDKVSGGVLDRFASRRDQLMGHPTAPAPVPGHTYELCTLCWERAGRKYRLQYPEPLGATVETRCDVCAEQFIKTHGPGTAVPVDG